MVYWVVLLYMILDMVLLKAGMMSPCANEVETILFDKYRYEKKAMFQNWSMDILECVIQNKHVIEFLSYKILKLIFAYLNWSSIYRCFQL